MSDKRQDRDECSWCRARAAQMVDEGGAPKCYECEVRLQAGAIQLLRDMLANAQASRDDLRDQLGERDGVITQIRASLDQMQALYDERGSKIMEVIAENDALRGDPAPIPDATPEQEAAYAAELNASVVAEMARIASIPEPAPVAGGEPVTPRVLAWLATQAVNVGEGAVSRAVALVLARDAYGRAKYGQGLCMGDGRNTAEDLRQELGDAMQYAIKARAEGLAGDELEEMRDLAHLLWLLVCADNVEGGR